MKVISNLKPIVYHTQDTVRIVNQKQMFVYIKNGAYPVDIYTSIDDKTNKELLVMIFLKPDTEHLYRSWCNYELE